MSISISDSIRTDEEIFTGLSSYKNADDELFGQGVEDFRYLQNKYKGFVYHAIHSCSDSLSHEEIEDISQETFLNLYNAIEKFKGKSLLKTYLHPIAVNNAKQHIRKTLTVKRGGGEENISLDDIEIDIPSSVKPPDESILDNLEVERIRKSVGSLDPNLRNVIELRFFEDRKHKEIAYELGIPEGSVGSYLKEALHVLKTMIPNEQKESETKIA